MSEYSEKLRDPCWQKKRLEILERDNWSCQYCNRKDMMLIVHHKTYSKSLEPWEYPDDMLITLCEDCHNKETNEREMADKTLIAILRKLFSVESIYTLSSSFSLIEPEINEYNLASAIANTFFDEEMYQLLIAMAKATPKNPNTLLDVKRRLLELSHNYDNQQEFAEEL